MSEHAANFSQDDLEAIQKRQAMAASFLSSISLFEDDEITTSVAAGKRPIVDTGILDSIRVAEREPPFITTAQSGGTSWRIGSILRSLISPKSSPRTSVNASRNRFGADDLDIVVVGHGDDEHGSHAGSLSNMDESNLTSTSLQQLQLQQAMQTPNLQSEFLVSSRGPSSSIFGFATAFRDKPFQTVTDISLEALNSLTSISRMSVSGGKIGSSSRNFGKTSETPTPGISNSKSMNDRNNTMLTDQLSSTLFKGGRYSAETELVPSSRSAFPGQAPYMLHLVSGKLLTAYPPSDNKSKFLQEKLVGTRVTFATSSGVPLSFFSVIPYMDNSREKTKRSRAKSIFGSQALLERVGVGVIEPFKRKLRVESYARLLVSSKALGPQNVEGPQYNPFFLDDPELKTGKHKTIITLPCFVASIIQYSRAADIKRELNEHFRETHPTVDPTLTLSQIRSLKAKMLDISMQANLELSTVASSYVLFEKLVLKRIENFVQVVDKILEISPREVYQHEFSIYVELEFNLFLPLWEILPHLDRVIEASDYSSVDEYCEGHTFFASLT
ncbi:hypothetical protein HDU67_009678 [Dinochytrium kinnereticum]|nr:hypothetical protein HDU67_009678 [Dinochytrium kinnereticum]